MDVNLIEVNIETSVMIINGEENFYLNEEMLKGAIFSAKSYACLSNKLLERLNMISDIYLQKANMLRLKTYDEQCDSLYTSFIKNLDELKTSKDKDKLLTIKDLLEEQNRMLDRNGCVEIF